MSSTNGTARMTSVCNLSIRLMERLRVEFFVDSFLTGCRKTLFSIGVGRGDWIRSSLPPNRTGSSPASGSPVGGSPPRGLTQRRLGLCKREQPLRGKESIGPALMIAPSAPTAPLLTLTQKAAQPHPEPGIQIRKGRVIAVLEIAKPASGDRVDARDDDLQALPIAALGQDANFVPQLFQALRARPSKSALEVIPKKVEAAMFRGVYNLRLYRMQL